MPSVRAEAVERGRRVVEEYRAGKRVPAPNEEQLDALVAALQDAPHVPEFLVDKYANSRMRSRPVAMPLTRSETIVLQGLADGKNFVELAAELGRTGKHAAQNLAREASRQLLGRLGANSREHAVAIGLALGLIEPPASPIYPPGKPLQTIGTHLIQPRGKPIPARHRQVLNRLVNGDSNAEIAVGLRLSEETVKQYVKELLAAYAARGRTHLAALAVRIGHVN